MSLNWKIFAGTALLVFAVLVGTLAIANVSARKAADQAIDAGLTQTSGLVKQLLETQARSLADGARVFVRNSQFVARIESRQSGDALDQSQEAADATHATWVQITDENGTRLAKSDDPGATPDDLSGSALVSGALEGEVTTGYGRDADSVIIQAVAVPIQNLGAAGGKIYGTLMAARVIGDSLAQQVHRATQSEVIFYAVATDGSPRVTATTLGSKDALAAWIRGAILSDSDATADSTGGRRADAQIDSTHFVGQGTQLLTASGAPVGGFIVLRSRDAALAPFTQLRNTIIMTGAIGLLLAFLMSYLLAMGITRPVGALVAATRRAADGDYAAEIPTGSRDEIGALADAFRAMLADLREKQALVEFLSSAESGRTVPLAKASTTVQQAAAVSGAITPGQLLATRYEIKEVLGAGGMGLVYKATDTVLGDVVAIKTLRPEALSSDPSALERFKSEILLARRISHRNVVRTHDIGESKGVYFITMEFVEGKSLKELIRSRGRLPVAVTLTVAKQLCRALEVAHEQGVIHRDIKPQNMVVEASGVLKVMDFGIARLAQRKGGEGYTQAGMVVGTPEYMAPEQLLGDDVDARVDLYAAGVVLYECLTGRLPFIADSPIALISKVLEETPPSPRSIHPDVPADLADLVLRTMSRDAAARPQTATALHDLLAQVG